MALSNAEKQAVFRARRKAEVEGFRAEVQSAVWALATACERARCPKLTNHLPDDPIEALAEIARRLEGKRLIVADRERKNGKNGHKPPAGGE